MKIKFTKVLGGAILAAALLGSAQATPLSLLLGGGSITAGDKLFDHWSLSQYVASDGRAFNAADIEVTALDDGGLNPGPGLRFLVRNGALSVDGDDIFAFVDLMFGFRASVLTPGMAIQGVSLGNLGASVGSNDLGDGSNDNGSYIRESLGTAAGLQDLGLNQVEFSILDSVTTSNTSASASFAPRSELWVTKNILVWATEATDDAELILFEQRFSQTGAPIPVPGTLALVTLALAGLGASRRRTP